MNSFYPQLQLKDIDSAVKNKLKDLLTELKGFKFVATLFLELEKIQRDDETLYRTFSLHWKAETFINENDIDHVFDSIYGVFISNIQKPLRQGTGGIIDSVIGHNINISKYNPLGGSNQIILTKELDRPRIMW